MRGKLPAVTAARYRLALHLQLNLSQVHRHRQEKTETAILLEILARLNGQPNAQQVSNVYPVAQQYSVGVVSQGNRSLHRGRRGHYDHRPSQHPMVLTSPAPMALAGPPAYGPPPATEQQGQRGDQHSRIGQVNAVAAKLAELTAILKSMD